jgi:hypothetical protein
MGKVPVQRRKGTIEIHWESQGLLEVTATLCRWCTDAPKISDLQPDSDDHSSANVSVSEWDYSNYNENQVRILNRAG